VKRVQQQLFGPAGRPRGRTAAASTHTFSDILDRKKHREGHRRFGDVGVRSSRVKRPQFRNVILGQLQGVVATESARRTTDVTVGGMFACCRNGTSISGFVNVCAVFSDNVGLSQNLTS
jgi:hypothetical protein